MPDNRRPGSGIGDGASRDPRDTVKAETVHAHGLRNCRYRGTARTHVQHVLTAAGTNIIRLSECLSPGITPPRRPRARSRFQQLCRSLPT
ncbi:transposase [Streptomyces sp. NPDC057910]|uniref:transposase n=1 Tax=Streptomyces sp. NPDC057910 TaxID=3346278 RepID=UPI0036E2E0C9